MPGELAVPFRTGDRVLVVPISQYGIVRGRKHGKVMVHFGTQNQTEIWAWYDPRDLLRQPDMVEVLP